MKQVSGPGRARVIGRAIAAAATALVLMSACTNANSFVGQAKQVEKTSPDKRPWFCDGTGTGTPVSGHGNGSHVHPIYEGKTKGPLSWEDCRKLAAELDQTRTATRGLETRAKGEAAGWQEIGEYIPGLGTHHSKGGPGGINIREVMQCLIKQGVDVTGGMPPDINDPKVKAALEACGVPEGGLPFPGMTPGTRPGGTPGTTPGMTPGGFPGMSTTFDPASPQFIIYGGPGPDAPLVGVAFAYGGAAPPPAAYAGENDWWHLHTKLCVGPNLETLAGAEEISDEECAALGGTQRSMSRPDGGGLWLLHVWLYPPYEYRSDLFISGHNCLLAPGTAPQSDPCWEIAHREPSLGPPPAPGGEHDGGHGH